MAVGNAENDAESLKLGCDSIKTNRVAGFRPPQASGRSYQSQLERMLAARCRLRAKVMIAFSSDCSFSA
jgi:hypothetical protein